jgi:hypothetical protein
MMLGRNCRFSVNNQTGGNVNVVIQARFWKFDSSGALVYSSETEVFNETAIASSASAWTEDGAFDNSTDLYIGADLEVYVEPAGSATGIVQVQIQRSTDGGTTWPSDGLGTPVASHYFNASSAAVTLSVEL